jgi:hypothetical protein
MARCEDYPCCGHGPPPLGDGGGCPEVKEDGSLSWPCAGCGVFMEVGRTTAFCDRCNERVRNGEPLPLGDPDDFF